MNGQTITRPSWALSCLGMRKLCLATSKIKRDKSNTETDQALAHQGADMPNKPNASM